MSYSEKHTVTLIKPAQRALREKVIQNNLTALVASVNNKSLAVRGWLLEASEPAWTQDGDAERGYTFRMFVTVSYTREDNTKPGKSEFPSLVRTIHTRASQPAFGKWAVGFVNGEAWTIPDDDDEMPASITDEIGYTEVTIPETWEDYFGHLFGLDSHIRRVRMALEAGITSGWRNRFHAALIGPPGCGKSDISLSIKEALGEDAVWVLDATATTAAGAIKELAEREILPRVIVIEEIEKAPEASMQFLLGILDLRGEIRKTTARATIQRNTKLFAIATVNDYELFKKLQAGALASRFTNRIHFNRPSRETLALILTREVRKVDGDEAWIAPTLDYCEEHNITDPREVIAICLCGRDELVTGEYQKMMAETARHAGDERA